MVALPRFEKKRLMGLIVALSFGLTSLFAVLELGVLVPATFVFGFLVLLPVVAILGADAPFVSSPDTAGTTNVETESTDEGPVVTLQRRYATGEIDEAEFERRLDRLLETEELEGAVDRGGPRTRDGRTAEIETESDSTSP